jgi:hypothetical protein
MIYFAAPPPRIEKFVCMAQVNLRTAAVNLAALREHGQNELVDILDSIRGKKVSRIARS